MLVATGTGIVGSNLAGLLDNYAFSFEESNTKLSVFTNASVVLAYLADILFMGLQVSLFRVLGVFLIIAPMVAITLLEDKKPMGRK